MARHIEAPIVIDAPPDRVWSVLTDMARMPAWNLFFTAMSGVLEPGARLSVRVHPPGRSSSTFKPIVGTVRPGRELRWKGHLLMAGHFEGGHHFLLEPAGDGATRFVQGEKFTGLLVGLILPGSAAASIEAGLHAMNGALKSEAERGRL